VLSTNCATVKVDDTECSTSLIPFDLHLKGDVPRLRILPDVFAVLLLMIVTSRRHVDAWLRSPGGSRANERARGEEEVSTDVGGGGVLSQLWRRSPRSQSRESSSWLVTQHQDCWYVVRVLSSCLFAVIQPQQKCTKDLTSFTVCYSNKTAAGQLVSNFIPSINNRQACAVCIAQPCRYCFYSVAQKWATRCLDKREIWHGGADRRVKKLKKEMPKVCEDNPCHNESLYWKAFMDSYVCLKCN